MYSTHEVALEGCTSEPLMNYLKALGVLRLVAREHEKTKGCWRNGVFVLGSALDERGLARFFAEHYKPSPVFAPWNGAGGFLSDSGTSLKTINALRDSSHERLRPLRAVLNTIDQVPILRRFKEARDNEKTLNKGKQDHKKSFSRSDEEALLLANQTVKKIKQTMLSEVRATFPDEVVRWLDACLAISFEDFTAAPLLGSGGCDGNLEFSANFLANVLRFLGLNSEIRDQWVKKALFARGEGKLVPTSIGQFSPGQIGGPNATQGFEGTSFINPLDFILMIEGVTLFSGSVSRKLESSNRTKSAFPFTVFSSSVGNTMDSVKDAKKARGEMWLPLWSRFAGLAEIVQVLAEGRAEINGKQVSYGLQFARAATSLGVDRGISAFVRYAFLQRSGKNYIATALGRFDVRARPDVDLLRDADAWLDRFRRTASGDKAPPRFKSALRRIESAIFAFCQFGGVTRFGEILCAFGNAERELARGERFREDVRVQPVSGLSLEWLRAADDKSMEFELALALAGIHDHEKKVGPIRANIEAVSFERRRPDWKKNGFSEVWNNASLSMNLLAVLERRVIDAEKLGCKDLPLLSPYKASVDAVSAYIAGDVDDRRIEELLWGMVLVNHSKLSGEPRSPGRSEKEHGDAESLAVMPRSYALLKLLFLSGALVTGNGTINVRPEPSIMSLLRAGRTAGACAIASRRLRASGLTTMTHRKGAEPFNELDWQTDAVDSMRLGAALLFPISASSVDSLRKMVVRPSHKYLSR